MLTVSADEKDDNQVTDGCRNGGVPFPLLARFPLAPFTTDNPKDTDGSSAITKVAQRTVLDNDRFASLENLEKGYRGTSVLDDLMLPTN